MPTDPESEDLLKTLDRLRETSNPRTNHFRSCLGVFQGGGVRGAAFAGAYAAAYECGVRFNAVAGTSAGAIVAALIAAGSTPKQIVKSMQDAPLSTFMPPPSDKNAPFPASLLAKALVPLSHVIHVISFHRARVVVTASRIWRYGGMYGSDALLDWIAEELRSAAQTREPVKFADLATPLYVVATNLNTAEPALFGPHTPEVDVATAVASSCSIPGFFQPQRLPTRGTLVDGGLISNLPTYVFNTRSSDSITDTIHSRVLAFQLHAEPGEPPKTATPIAYLREIASAIVDGGTHIQSILQPEVNRVTISTGDVGATDFEKIDSTSKRRLFTSGWTAAHDFFADEGALVRPRARSLVGYYELLLLCAETLALDSTSVCLQFRQPRSILQIIPALVHARIQGKSVTLVHGPPDGNQDDYATNFLSILGCEVQAKPTLEWQGLAAYDDCGPNMIAIIAGDSEQSAWGQFTVAPIAQYRRGVDDIALHALAAELPSQTAPPRARAVRLGGVEFAFLADRLRQVPCYRNSEFRLVDVPLNSIALMTTKSFRHRTVCVDLLYRLLLDVPLRTNEVPCVLTDGGAKSVVVPPLFERHGKWHVLIDGLSRCAAARRRGESHVTAVVVSDIQQPLPATLVASHGERALDAIASVSRTTEIHDRYHGFQQSLVRRIEPAVHSGSDLQ